MNEAYLTKDVKCGTVFYVFVWWCDMLTCCRSWKNLESHGDLILLFPGLESRGNGST